MLKHLCHHNAAPYCKVTDGNAYCDATLALIQDGKAQVSWQSAALVWRSEGLQDSIAHHLLNYLPPTACGCF